MIDPDKKGIITFAVEHDFSVSDRDKWKAQLTLWISRSQKTDEDPSKKAEKILQAAINGTKMNGEIWSGVENFSLRSRIKQFCGFDIVAGRGRLYKPLSRRGPNHPEKLRSKEVENKNDEVYLDITLEELLEQREAYKQILFQEFPFTENPVYEAQVNGLAEAVVKLDHISGDFLTASGKSLEILLKIRDGLKKDMDDFMKLLKIHPTQLKDKAEDIDRGDVGNLIVQWEKFGEISEMYETVDAIQELIQSVRQLEQLRTDGTPQLADYLMWHKTGCRGCSFTCEHGVEYKLLRGFSSEELYAAAEQAYEAFGFGLRKDES